MDLYQNPLTLLRQLKGAPLACLLALSLVHQPVSQDWICLMTGYTDKPVSQALRLLREYGMITGSKNNWQVMNGGLNVPLFATRNNSELGHTTTTATIEGSEDLRSTAAVACRKNSELRVKRTRKNSELENLLYDVGIREPTLTDLIKLEWVKVDYVKVWIKDYRERGYKLGLLIHKLKSNDAVPAEAGKEYRRYIDGQFAQVGEY